MPCAFRVEAYNSGDSREIWFIKRALILTWEKVGTWNETYLIPSFWLVINIINRERAKMDELETRQEGKDPSVAFGMAFLALLQEKRVSIKAAATCLCLLRPECRQTTLLMFCFAFPASPRLNRPLCRNVAAMSYMAWTCFLCVIFTFIVTSLQKFEWRYWSGRNGSFFVYFASNNSTASKTCFLIVWWEEKKQQHRRTVTLCFWSCAHHRILSWVFSKSMSLPCWLKDSRIMGFLTHSYFFLAVFYVCIAF